jgi:hypothetical protein
MVDPIPDGVVVAFRADLGKHLISRVHSGGLAADRLDLAAFHGDPLGQQEVAEHGSGQPDAEHRPGQDRFAGEFVVAEHEQGIDQCEPTHLAGTPPAMLMKEGKNTRTVIIR